MPLSLLPSDGYGRMDVFMTASGSVSKAAQACISCRKQKRKCDKTLPMCALCARMGRQCDYTDTPAAPTADDLAVLQARLADLEKRLSAANANANNGHSPGTGTGSSPDVNMELSPPASTSTIAPPSETDHSTTGSGSTRINSWVGGPLWTAPQGASNFPSAIFLDIDCFKWAGMHISKPNVHVPAEVFAILTNTPTTIQDATASYFDSIHPWFPIISKKRMSIGTSLQEGGPDIAMLFLAMKLVAFPSHHATGIPPAQDPLYMASKRFLSLLEASGCLSLAHLQAKILVTIYELGHAIYPSAWMSIGSCARYMDIIGLPSFKESSTFLGSVTTWTEMEERRRCWWAVYILDRILCLGNKKRFALPEEPDDHFLLPVDDDAWDNGDPARSLQMGVQTALEQPQAPFARLAQGAILISNILTHCRDRITMFRKGQVDSSDPDQAIGRVQSLLDTINTYTEITSSELQSASAAHNSNSGSSPDSSSSQNPAKYSYFARLTPRCLATSAAILLYDAYACPENLCDGPSPLGSDSFPPKQPSQLQMQVTAVNGLRTSSLAMRELSLEMLDNVMLPSEQQKISPLCLDSLYCAVASLHWLFKEGGEKGIGEALGDVRTCMGRLGMRWSLGRVYGDVMGFHDVTVSMALRSL
ncbi:hypothetical protein V8F33_002801 [Rhypophila sp. PSN 637]